MSALATLNKNLTLRTLRKVPEITVYFWIIKLLSTAMGEATSDYLVFHINPYVAVAVGSLGLIVALILQLVARRYLPWIYWLAIVMVAIFGTMAADVLHVVMGIPYLDSTVFFAVVLAVVFVAWYVSEKTLSIHSIDMPRRELFYWAAVMATFALGTAAGDMTASTLGLGYLDSGVLFTVLFVVPGLGFWLLGASFADWFGKPYLGGLGLGDTKVSLVLTVVIVLLVGYVSVTRVDVNPEPARSS